MTGSTAPQRALHRLGRVAAPADRLAAVRLPDTLTADPLARLEAAPLEESLLETVLAPLGRDGGAAAMPVQGIRRAARHARLASLPRPAAQPSAPSTRVAIREQAAVGRSSPHVPRLRGRTREAAHMAVPPVGLERAGEPGRAAAAHLGGEAARFAAGGRTASCDGEQRRAVAPERAGGLRTAAAQVPGGAAAVATPVAAGWSTDAGDPPVAALLEAALSRLPLQPTGDTAPAGAAEQPQAGAPRDPGRRRGTATEAPLVAGGRGATSEPLPGPGPAPRLAPARRRPSLDPAPPTHAAVPYGAALDAAPPAAAHGTGGLAELVRRWEGGRIGYEAEGIGRPGQPESNASALPSGPETDDELARALERLLVGELRRSGIAP